MFLLSLGEEYTKCLMKWYFEIVQGELLQKDPMKSLTIFFFQAVIQKLPVVVIDTF